MAVRAPRTLSLTLDAETILLLSTTLDGVVNGDAWTLLDYIIQECERRKESLEDKGDCRGFPD